MYVVHILQIYGCEEEVKGRDDNAKEDNALSTRTAAVYGYMAAFHQIEHIWGKWEMYVNVTRK